MPDKQKGLTDQRTQMLKEGSKDGRVTAIRYYVCLLLAFLRSLRCLDQQQFEFHWGSKASLHNKRILTPISFDVLSFGGSTTWGTTLQSRDFAYPSLLARDPLIGRSDNLAIRASSAVWPSQCLQTMIYEQETANVEYNVVIFEFSINGITGLKLLLSRIRTRYPHALLIYVDLYSNRQPGWSNCVGENCRMNDIKQAALRELVLTVGGIMVSLPRPSDPMKFDDVLHFFAEDMHHLGPEGHQWVSDQVAALIRVHGETTIGEKGGWMEGDLCASWFESGAVSPLVKLEGGQMNQFAKGKYAYEINSQATLRLMTQQLQGETPLILVFMSKGNPSLYPLLQANLDGSSSTIVVNPLNARWEMDHVTSTQGVAMISPGTTHYVIHLQNLETTKEYPFRLVGVVMCAACQALHVDLTKTCRSLGCLQIVPDDEKKRFVY